MSNERICYLTSYPAHLPYLLISLDTLRRYWSGDVFVYAWPESFEQVKRIAEDKRLFVNAVLRNPWQRGKNSQFLDKIRLVRSMEGQVERVMYLDADTSIHGSVQPLLNMLDRHSFVATQFNDWTTAGGVIKNRINRLIDYPAIDRNAIDVVTSTIWPSVNGGVWCCRPDSPVLRRWEEWTLDAKEGVFIADEAVLHLMQIVFNSTEFFVATEQGRWNCSPKHMSDKLAWSDLRVLHYHGDSNARPAKSQRGFDIWWPMWTRAWEDNLGGCQEWWPQIQADRRRANKYMKRIEEMKHDG